MPHPDLHSTLREWLASRPGLARHFTKHGIDLCRDAEKSVSELCRERNLDPLIVKSELDRFRSSAHHELGADWATASLAELCQHLEDVHHAYYRRELPRLSDLLAKVTSAYNASHPDMRKLETAFQAFCARLESHIEREQRELFPAIRELAKSKLPAGPHGLVGQVNRLEQDHDAVDAEILRIRELTHGFVAPLDVCQTFQSLLDGLWDLEMNLHQNVHEENGYLFPRALRYEVALRAAQRAKEPVS